MSIANKIVVGLVGLTVMAVIFSAMLPIMGEVTDADDTFKNTGIYYMESPITSSITYNYTSDGVTGVWTVNGDTLNVSTTNIIVTDTLIVRGAGTTGQIRGAVDQTFKTASFIVSTDGIDYDYTTMNDTNLTGSWTYDYVYCAVNSEASFIMSDPGASINYMLNDSPIVGFGVTKVGAGPWATFKINGDMENVTVESLTANVTVSNIQINKTAIAGYVDLYDFNSITFTATDTSNNTVDATYNAVIIPSSVTAEKAIHPDGPTTAILNMLPIVIGAGLLLGAIAFMIVTRK